MNQTSYYKLLRRVGPSQLRALHLLPTIEESVAAAKELVWPRSAPPPTWNYLRGGLGFGCFVGRKFKLVPYCVHVPGACFVDPVVSRLRSIFEYVCLTKARMLRIAPGVAIDAFENEPEYSRFPARLISWRGQRYEEYLSLKRLENLTKRVALSLGMLADDLINQVSHLRQESANALDHLQIPIKQSLLASLCGLSRGVFSVQASKLEGPGRCEVRYASTRLLDLKFWKVFLSDHRAKCLGLGESLQPVPV